jgi:hypothetical protein
MTVWPPSRTPGAAGSGCHHQLAPGDLWDWRVGRLHVASSRVTCFSLGELCSFRTGDFEFETPLMSSLDDQALLLMSVFFFFF